MYAITGVTGATGDAGRPGMKGVPGVVRTGAFEIMFSVTVVHKKKHIVVALS